MILGFHVSLLSQERKKVCQLHWPKIYMRDVSCWLMACNCKQPEIYILLLVVSTNINLQRYYLLLAGLVWEKNTVPDWKFTIVYEQANRLKRPVSKKNMATWGVGVWTWSAFFSLGKKSLWLPQLLSKSHLPYPCEKLYVCVSLNLDTVVSS